MYRPVCPFFPAFAAGFIAAAPTQIEAADPDKPSSVAPTAVATAVSTNADSRHFTEHLFLENGPASGFMPTYQRELAITGQRAAYSRLRSPAALLSALHAADRRGYGYHDYLASRGVGLFADGFVDALRETAADELPIEQWKEAGSHAASFVARAIHGTIGNTANEHVDPLSPSPQLRTDDLESSWEAETGRRTGLTHVGFRNAIDPYVTLAIGHLVDGKPVFLETRATMITDLRELDRIRLQERLVIPIFDSVKAVIGGSAYPTEIADRDGMYSFSARLERSTRSMTWFFGTLAAKRTDGNEVRCEAGIILFDW